MSDNGDGRLIVDPEQLTLRDMQRARVMLGGRNPWEILDQGDETRVALIIWCLRSRTDPEFTMDMAMDAPMSEFARRDADPPQTPPRGSRGKSRSTRSVSGSTPPPRELETEPSSGNGSA